MDRVVRLSVCVWHANISETERDRYYYYYYYYYVELVRLVTMKLKYEITLPDSQSAVGFATGNAVSPFLAFPDEWGSQRRVACGTGNHYYYYLFIAPKQLTKTKTYQNMIKAVIHMSQNKTISLPDTAFSRSPLTRYNVGYICPPGSG